MQVVQVKRAAWAASSPPPPHSPAARAKSSESVVSSPQHPTPFIPTIAPTSPRARRQAPRLQADGVPRSAYFSPPPPGGWFVEEYAAPMLAASAPHSKTQPSSSYSGDDTLSFVRAFPYEWESLLASKRVAPRFRRLVVRPPPTRPVRAVGYAGRYEHSPFKVKQTACSISMETTRCIGLGVRTKAQLEGFAGRGGAPFTGG